MLSVHLVTAHCGRRVGGCSHVRWLLPLRYPSNANHFSITHGTDYRRADVVVVERSWTDDAAQARDLVRRTRDDGATLVYTTDDNILDLRIEGDVARWLSPAHQEVIRYVAAEADGVIVSTPPLARQMAALNRLVVEVPNAVDERLFHRPIGDERRARDNRPLVIGYMGTATHDDDLLTIAPALRRVLAEGGGGVEFELVGGVARPDTLEEFTGLPVRVRQVGHEVEYPAFVRWMARELHWDVAVAPLCDDVFTRAKSDLKALDYAGLGVPGVFSEVGPYAASVRHGETGLLAANEPDAWADCLRRLLADAGLRRRIAAGAGEWLSSSRVLRHRAGDWRHAIETLVRSRPARARTSAPGGKSVSARTTASAGASAPPGVSASDHTAGRLAAPAGPYGATARVIIPGSVNYFYDRAGERITAALRGLGATAELTTLGNCADAPACDWCFFVNPYEIAAGHGDHAGAVALMRDAAARCGRAVAVALECVQTPWFAHSARLCRDVGLAALLDLGFHSQLEALPPDVAGIYHFCFNGLTAAERAAVTAAPLESDRPIPWVLVGHQSAERAELAYRLVREAAPGGFVYLPRLSPVTESGPHLNGRQFAQVLSRAKVQVWCSHHPHFYMESERFRDSLLSGSVPLKIVDRSPAPSRVFPFESLVAEQADAPAWLRQTPYAPAWRRFREEFLALPSLEAGLAAFIGVDASGPGPVAAAAETRAEVRPRAEPVDEGVLLET